MNSRAKGQRGEREWAEWLNEHFGLTARRGQQHRGGPDSPDVIGGIPGTHPEVKRTQHLRLPEALASAIVRLGARRLP
jgi:Holliday junction resolvase